jgi:hypothetical protein
MWRPEGETCASKRRETGEIIGLEYGSKPRMAHERKRLAKIGESGTTSLLSEISS